jgi:hypothetical protein
MRTRTLLLLAVGCGLAILLAGGIQLYRLSGDQESTTTQLAIGAAGRAGDLRVTVVGGVERDGLMRVEVRLSGVNDPAGLDDFRLVVNGGPIEPLAPAQAGDGACDGFTVNEQTCSLVFGTAEVEGSARVLLLRRGEDTLRWVLA